MLCTTVNGQAETSIWVNRAMAGQRRLRRHFRFTGKADLNAEKGEVQRRAAPRHERSDDLHTAENYRA